MGFSDFQNAAYVFSIIGCILGAGALTSQVHTAANFSTSGICCWKIYPSEWLDNNDKSVGSRATDDYENEYTQDTAFGVRCCGGNFSRLNARNSKACGIKHHQYSVPMRWYEKYIGSRYF